MKGTCKTCKTEIEIEGKAPMTDGYICIGCQIKYEGAFFRHLAKRRIETKEIEKDGE